MRYQEPEFAPWDGRRVPLTFVGGYLGSGKTTLINRVLATTDRPIAVMVNDVGEVNIDARLIRRASGDTIELTDGCVCCSLVDGFGAAFDSIRARPEPPDHVIVELSGVADPTRVLPWGKSAGFRLDGVVTLVGADRFSALVERPELAELVQAQVSGADLVGLTRTDLADPAQVHAVQALIDDLNPAVSAVPVGLGDAADLLTALLRIGGRRPGGATDTGPATLFDRHVVDRIPLPQPIDIAQMHAVLDELGPNVMRAKAIIVDPVGQHWSIQVVGTRREIEPLPAVESEPTTDLITIGL